MKSLVSKPHHLIFVGSLCCSLAACGGSSGGSSGDSDPVPDVNVAPIATITAPGGLSVTGFTTISLDGSTSSDTDGSIAQYQWSQTSGNVVILTNADQSTFEFTPGNINETLTFQLLVTDNLGATNTSTVDVEVSAYFKQLSAGTSHYCAIVAQNSGDEVYCWGSDSYELNQPMQIDAPLAVYSGGFNSCVVNATQVGCWGKNDYGINEVPSLINTQDIVIGNRHACALDDNGVQCWGENSYNQLDVPTLSNPVNITASIFSTCAQDDTGVVCWGRDVSGVLDAPQMTNVQALFGGSSSHHCGIDDGGLVCWGDNENEQAPIRESLMGYINISDVALGRNYSCVLSGNDDGEQAGSCFGNDTGLGAPGSVGVTDNVPAMNHPRQLASAYDNACAIDDSGIVCWGANYNDQTNPPPMNDIVATTSGYNHSCAISKVDETTNKLDCWGTNFMGVTNVLDFVNPVYVSASDDRSCVIDDNGPYCWGRLLSFTPTTEAIELPVEWTSVQAIIASYDTICALTDNSVKCHSLNDEYGATNVAELVEPSALVAGDTFYCAVDTQGVKCWGNVWGRPFEVQTPQLNNPTSLSAQDSHACAIADNQVHCWGSGVALVDIPALSNPIKVVAGPRHSCAIDDNGVSCWGKNLFGQLDVPTLSNPTDVTVGNRYSCANDDTGLVCWGWNGFGGAAVPLKPEQASMN
jgi:alpha-tubulin suppressor-like RCC1 family protein